MANTLGTLMKRRKPKPGTPSNNSTGQKIVKYFKNKIQLMTKIDMVCLFLWIATLLLLVDFIVVVAVTGLSAEVHANASAATGGVFIVSICAAIITTVVARYLQKRRESGAA